MSAQLKIVDDRTTIYCAQAFWRDKRKLAAGVMKQFKTQEAAVNVARNMASRNAGAIAFSVTGNPEADYWEEPVLLATFGEVPELAG